MLVLQYYVGGDNSQHANAAGRKLSGLPPAVSRDGGKTWAFEGEGLSSNVLMHCNYWGYNIQTTNGVLLGTGNSAMLVDEDANILEGPWGVTREKNGFASGEPWHRRVACPNGRLVASTYADKYKTNDKDNNCTHFLESLDGGRSWKTVSRIADAATAPWGNEGANESTIECLADGALVCVMRTGTREVVYKEKYVAEPMLLARSIDGGFTWEYTKLTQAGVYPRMLLMSNGILVLSFGRPGNNLVFSTDGGKTWGHEVAVTHADVKTSGYMDFAEVAPGRLLVVYDLHDTDKNGIWLWEPKGVNGVFGCFVDVRRLWGGGGDKTVDDRQKTIDLFEKDHGKLTVDPLKDESGEMKDEWPLGYGQKTAGQEPEPIDSRQVDVLNQALEGKPGGV